MPKTIPLALKNHLAENLTTIAVCWKVTRQDHVSFHFTNHDVDLVIDGDTYEASSGMMPSEWDQARGLAVANAEAVAFLESDKVIEAEVHGRLFDYATVDIFLVNHADVSMGKMYLLQGGIIGEVEMRDIAGTFELRGKAQRLQQNIIELYSQGCRADLGDSRCQVDIESSASPFRYEGTVTAVDPSHPRRKFTDTASIGLGPFPESAATGAPLADVFRFGRLTWGIGLSGGGALSGGGLNDGLEMEVKTWDAETGEFELLESMGFEINVGDPFVARFGCDKSLTTCRDRFENLLNFRGEPHVPGPDFLNIVYIRAPEMEEG